MQLRKYTVDGPFESQEQLDQNWTKIEEEFQKKANSTHTHSMDDVNGIAAEFNKKLNASEKGQQGGLATLDENGQVKQVMDSATVRNYLHNEELTAKLPTALKSLYLVDGYDTTKSQQENDLSSTELIYLHILQTGLFEWFNSRLQLPNTLLGLIIEGVEPIDAVVIDNLSTSLQILKLIKIDALTLPTLPATLQKIEITGTDLSSIDISGLIAVESINLQGNAFASDDLDALLVTAKTLAEDNNKQDVVLDISGNLGLTTRTDIIEILIDTYNWTIIYDEEGQYV